MNMTTPLSSRSIATPRHRMMPSSSVPERDQFNRINTPSPYIQERMGSRFYGPSWELGVGTYDSPDEPMRSWSHTNSPLSTGGNTEVQELRERMNAVQEELKGVKDQLKEVLDQQSQQQKKNGRPKIPPELSVGHIMMLALWYTIQFTVTVLIFTIEQSENSTCKS